MFRKIFSRNEPLFGEQPREKLGRNEDICPNAKNKWIKIGLGVVVGAALAAAVTVAVIYLFKSGALGNALQNVQSFMPTQMPPALSFVQSPAFIAGSIAFGGTVALGGVSYLGYHGIKGISGKIKEHKEEKIPAFLRGDDLFQQHQVRDPHQIPTPESPVYDGL